jgi:curli biogenesis system outer membrane secretion channel CsgG
MRAKSLTKVTALTVAMLTGSVVPTTLRAQDGADARPTVAVMYFNNGAVGRQAEFEPLSKGLADMLITQLSANAGIRVVERDQLQHLLQEQNLAKDGRVDAQTAVAVGKVLGARHMIFGGFVTDGRGNMQIHARSVNVETSQIEHTESVSGKTDSFMELVSTLADRLNRGLKLPEVPRAVREASSERAKKLPFQMAMLYARGISEKDAGNAERAVEYFRRVVDAFPDYEPAQRELEKLRHAHSGA